MNATKRRTSPLQTHGGNPYFEVTSADHDETRVDVELSEIGEEHDLHHEGGPTTAGASAKDQQRRINSLSGVLRGVGALVVVASSSTFLFQQWEKGDDLVRYFALLAQSGLLSAFGFFCAVEIRESKSARTFMALAAGIVPALFCILGGLVYSQFSVDGGTTPVAGYATWVAPSPFSALATVVATLAVAAPVAFLSFLSLARPQAKLLTALFVVANASLLLPTRAPEAAAALLASLIVGLGFVEWKRWRTESAMRTREGAIVRAMIATPALLLVARSALHYELSPFMGAVVCFAVSALTFVAGRGTTNETFGNQCHAFAIPPAALGWSIFSFAMHTTFALPDAAFLPLAALPFSATLGIMSLAVRSDGRRHRDAAVAVSLLATGGNLLIAGGIISAFVALVFGILSVGYGFFFDRRPLLGLGAVTAVAALLSHVGFAIEHYAHLHWTSLSVLGIAVILSASILERHHAAIADHVRRIKTRARGEGLG